MTAFLDRHQKTTELRLDGFPPALAGDLAFKRFCLPHLSSRRSADHTVLAERARFHLRNARWVRVPTTEGAIQAYVFEPDAATAPRGGVLIAHGWTSEASFMAVFAEQLRRTGFRVVTFDQPGHGKSEQRHASLVDCSRALVQVAEALGPVRYAVAHSMGGLAVLMAGEGEAPMPRPCPFERYVLVSTPNQFTAITREFADELGLDDWGLRAFERHLQRIAHRTVASFSAVNLLSAIDRPALILHARDDTEVPFRNAEEIRAACPRAELRAFDGLGHRNILFAPPVIRAAISYLTNG
jgi:pimeloyl-ACP methyl ester carboxylesterase